MAGFDFNGEHLSIVDDDKQQVNLSSRQALDLLRWLYDNRGALYSKAYQGQPGVRQLEIRLYEENLGYLDTLKEAIPDLHEHRPAARVLNVRLDLVTERAIQLLKELQVEYKIHPMLEEDDEVFAQG